MRLIVIVLSALSLHAQSLSLKRTNWSYYGTSGIKLSNDNNNGNLTFDFPVPDTKTNNGTKTSTTTTTTPPPSMNYLYTTYAGSLAGYQAISFTLQISTTGTPFFNYVTEPFNTCVFPAHARPYFASNGIDLGEEFGRWWSNPLAYELGQGTVTITVPLTPDAWSSVYGKFATYDATTMAMFQEALRTVTNVGLTFGGGCFFGHGVFVTGGTAQFQLSSVTIW